MINTDGNSLANTNNDSHLIAMLQEAVQRHRDGRFEEAKCFYLQILAVQHEHPDALHLLGLVYDQSGHRREAEGLIRQAIRIMPANPIYHHSLGNVLQKLGAIEKAKTSYHLAIQHDPGYAEAFYEMGLLLHHQNDLDGAVNAYRKALKLKPDLIEAGMNLGHALQSKSQLDEAIACFRTVLRFNPKNSQALFCMSTLFADQQNNDQAIALLKQVLHNDPDHLEAHYTLGVMHKKMGMWSEALGHFDKALTIKPDMASSYNAMGLVYKAQHHFKKAVFCFQKASALDPQFVEAYNNLANTFQEMGLYSQAFSCLCTALRLHKKYAIAWHNLGNIFQKTARYKKAIACYRRALQLNPDLPHIHYHLGLAYQNHKQPEQAIACYKKAIAMDASHIHAKCYLFHQLRQTCAWEGLESLEREIDHDTQYCLDHDQKPAEMPFLSLTRHADPKLNFFIARAWSRHLEQRWSANKTTFSRTPKSKITIAYLSSRFRNAATAHLMLGLFGLHDRKRFTTHCYSYGIDDGSYFRKRIEKECDRFIDIRECGHQQAAERIHADGVDILIDLKGYTRNNRLDICAMRPAPVQVSYIGFTGSTGANFLDYMITDKIVTPPDESQWYSEKFIYMPHCYMVNDDHKAISEKSWTRHDFGLPETGFVFCSFNLPLKIEPKMFDAWMTILASVPDSILWMLDGNQAYKANIRDQAAKRNVNPQRIVFAPLMQLDNHLARYRLADLVLDTATVNGHTTTSDALWAGVPVLALYGRHFMSRVSASLLNAIDLPEMVTHDLGQYAQTAIRLAHHPDEYEALRAKLKRNRTSQPLFDTARFARNLEKAYETIWQIYLAGEQPRQIEITD